MLKRGIYLAPSQFEAMFVSSVHTQNDLACTVQAAEETLSEIGIKRRDTDAPVRYHRCRDGHTGNADRRGRAGACIGRNGVCDGAPCRNLRKCTDLPDFPSFRNGRSRAERRELHCWFRAMLDFSAQPENCGKKLLAHGEVRLFCGLSSMQYLCAKIGISYENACIRSLHGRKGDLLGAVSYHEKTFALTGGDNNAQFVCRSLADAGLGGVKVYIGEKSRLTRRKSVEGNGIGACRNPLRRSCRDACPQSEFCKSV